MAQLKNREKAVNLNFGIPISLADTLQDLPATGNVQPYTDSDLNLVSTAVLSGPQSGFTTNNTFTNWRKRGRDSGDLFPPASANPAMRSFSFAGNMLSILGEDVAAQIQQQQQEIERFIALQTERVRSDLEEKRKRQSRRFMADLERTIIKKLKQKEAEIESIGKVNCALEERVRSLCIENQLWQNLARSNEATANVLSSNLEQVLAQANEGHGDSEEDAYAAEFCCYNNNHHNKSSGSRRGSGRNKSKEEEEEEGEDTAMGRGGAGTARRARPACCCCHAGTSASAVPAPLPSTPAQSVNLPRLPPSRSTCLEPWYHTIPSHRHHLHHGGDDIGNRKTERKKKKKKTQGRKKIH